MLQTWNLKKVNETHQQQGFDPETARPLAQQACNSCRIKKLRCSGQKSGCTRCLTLVQECIYAEPGTRGRGRKRKTEDNSAKPCGNNDADRPSASDTLSSTRLKSPSGAEALQSYTASEPPTPDLLTPFIPSRTDSIVSGNSIIDMGQYEAHEADSKLTRLTGPVTPREITGSSMSWQDTSHESNMLQFKNMSELEVMGHGTANLFQMSIARDEVFVPSYNDISLPDTPASILTTMNYPNLSSHTTLTNDAASLSKNRLGPDCQPRGACQCLQRVVLLLEEVDCLHEEGSVQEPGAWLSRLKEALRCGDSLLTCSSCQVKPENVSILGLLTDRLTTICEMIVSKYFEIMHNSPCTSVIGAANAPWLISLGEFEIDCVSEWSVLIRAVLTMQLRALDNFIHRLKGVTDPLGKRRKMDAMQRRTHGLLSKVTQPTA